MKSVLMMRLTAMGDVAMAAPIVASVCKANPDVRFTFLSTPLFEPFFEPLPNFTFIGTNIRREKSGLTGLWRLFRSLRKKGGTPDEPRKFDIVLDLHDVLRTKVLRKLFRLSGAKVATIDKGRVEKRALVNGSDHRQLKRTTERYADVFRKAGLIVPDETFVRTAPVLPQIVLPVAAHRSEETWVGISPFAQHKAKTYPPQKMIEVVKGLLAQPNVRIFFFGGGDVEAEAARVMIENATRDNHDLRFHCFNAINIMKLKDEMALMAHLDCMISMDSSNMHICSLFGVRVVSIWGGTHPFAGFLGYGQSEADVVQREDITCRPCSVFGNVPCKHDDLRCFDIAPETIVSKVLEK